MTANGLEIIPYHREYRQNFIDLNQQWLEEYFTVEPHDLEILHDCESTILAQGGYIFFARYGDEIAGCYALLKMSDGVYELGKMAVSKSLRGQRIGQRLMDHCVRFARKKQWEKLILYSSIKLTNALHIYKKFGFREIPLEENSPYQRSSIKMALIFDEAS